MRKLPARSLTLLLAGVLALALTACGGDDNGGEAVTSVTIEGTDSLAYEPSSLNVAAGEEITVTMNCGPSVEHDFIIRNFEGEREIVACDPGGSGTGTFTVAAGDYEFYCSVPGHEAAGMVGTITAS